MSVTILSKPPTSGSIIERWYDACGACTRIHFELPDQASWVGVFGNGDVSTHTAAVLFGARPFAFVIAGGIGYIVDLTTGELVHKTERDTFVDAICVPDRDFVVVCDWTEVYAIGSAGELWRSERVAMDGIILEDSSKTKVAGRVWQLDGWYRFELILDGWRFGQKERIVESRE